MSKAFRAAFHRVGPLLAATAGGVRAHDRQVRALDGGLHGREVAVGIHRPPQPAGVTI